MASASQALCLSCPVSSVKAYVWQHIGRADGQLLVEEQFPRRIHFTLYDEGGAVQWESGWHGIAGKDTCTRQVSKPKSKTRPRQSRLVYDIGTVIISLDAFRFTGMESDWFHCCELIRKAGDNEFCTMARRYIACSITLFLN